MNQTAVINIKTLPSIKNRAMQIANELGLNLSSVINGYLAQFVRTKTVFFSLEEKPSKYLIKQLNKSQQDVKSGRIISFADSSDALKYLDEISSKRKKYNKN